MCHITDLKYHKTRFSTKRIDLCFIGNHITYMAGDNPILVSTLQYQVMIIFRYYTCPIMSLTGVDVIFSGIWRLFIHTAVFDDEKQ